MANNSKKYVSLTRLSNFLDNIKTMYARIGHKHTISDISDYTVDSQLSKDSTNPVQNKVLDAEFEAIGDAMGALELAIDGKADESHNHAIADVSGLQSALDGKANSSHGTHVSYSTTVPVMDGSASAGSANTVARSDHKHPTDTSRASKTDFDTHVANTTAHITSTERTNWGTAYTHSQAAHAPSNAQANQNAFSNIAVSGQTTVAADTTTDTVTFAGSNVSITTDATNDKVTFAVADGSTSAKGVVQLTNSTSSTSTTTAATPSSVKSAYDLANTAKTNAATARTRADSAYTLAESKVDSLSDLGITATATELNYMDGVTSSVQTQLDEKAASNHNHIYYGVCSTAAATAAKTASLSNYALVTGGIVSVKFTNAVPASATLNINSKGAKSIYYRGAAITADIIKAGDIATFIYSSQYHLISIDRWQQDIDAKQAKITGAATTITGSNLTVSRALISNSSGKVAVSAVTSTELGYLDGVTSNVQTQFDNVNNKLQDVVYSDESDEYTASVPLNADTLGGRNASEYALVTTTNNLQTQIDGKAPAGYGLGGNAKQIEWSEIDNITENGWYCGYIENGVYVNNIRINYFLLVADFYDDNSGTQTLYCTSNGNKLVRQKRMLSGSSSDDWVWGWDEWECPEPPMELGVEYRTTERHNEAVVYKRLNPSSGRMQYRLGESDEWYDYAEHIGAIPIGAYGFGAPAVQLYGDVKDITVSGWYFYNSGNSSGAPQGTYGLIHASVSAEFTRLDFYTEDLVPNHAVLNKRWNSWGEWEWENPPMTFDTTYRTTERWNGRPVYTRLVSLGNMPDGNTYKEVIFPVSGGSAEVFSVIGMNSTGCSLPAHFADGNSQYLSAEPCNGGTGICVRMKNGIASWTAYAIVKFILC